MKSPRIYFVTREALITAYRKMEDDDRAEGLGNPVADPEAEADSLLNYLPEHEHPYTVGQITARALTDAGLSNLSDMQAVFDAVETALEGVYFGEEAKGLSNAPSEGGAS